MYIFIISIGLRINLVNFVTYGNLVPINVVDFDCIAKKCVVNPTAKATKQRIIVNMLAKQHFRVEHFPILFV